MCLCFECLCKMHLMKAKHNQTKLAGHWQSVISVGLHLRPDRACEFLQIGSKFIPLKAVIGLLSDFICALIFRSFRLRFLWIKLSDFSSF